MGGGWAGDLNVITMDIEHHNHRQIERLNQHGGRTLTIVDLIRAGTLSAPMAAYAFRAMARGASLMTGARPGGAGKTTLMAAILHLLPPGVRVVTIESADRIAAAATGPSCHLVHEIGDGHWYGYWRWSTWASSRMMARSP